MAAVANPSSLTIGLHCMYCGRPVTVEYLPETAGEASSPAPAWECPHWQCDKSQALGGVRAIARVWKGHGTRPIDLHDLPMITAPRPSSAEGPPSD